MDFSGFRLQYNGVTMRRKIFEKNCRSTSTAAALPISHSLTLLNFRSEWDPLSLPPHRRIYIYIYILWCYIFMLAISTLIYHILYPIIIIIIIISHVNIFSYLFYLFIYILYKRLSTFELLSCEMFSIN